MPTDPSSHCKRTGFILLKRKVSWYRRNSDMSLFANNYCQNKICDLGSNHQNTICVEPRIDSYFLNITFVFSKCLLTVMTSKKKSKKSDIVQKGRVGWTPKPYFYRVSHKKLHLVLEGCSTPKF